jgi:hypothetical protein
MEISPATDEQINKLPSIQKSAAEFAVPQMLGGRKRQRDYITPMVRRRRSATHPSKQTPDAVLSSRRVKDDIVAWSSRANY